MNTNNGQVCLNNIKHIIWDYNGTLLNDLDVCVDVINKVLGRRGLDKLSREAYQAVFDFPVKNYYEKIGFDFQKESFEIVGTEFIEEYNKKQTACLLQEGSIKMLDFFLN
ncbi:MAG: HAD hydrolase-like protein [Bacteroidota bacterium]|nr:HAD hydrolase-like protein [Bacteroidota bacterium]